jgi:chromosome segregation protein
LLLRDWYGYHWHQSQRDLTEAHEAARKRELILEQERGNYSVIDENLTSIRERISGLRARLNSWHHQTSQLHSHRETISRDLAVAEERTRSLQKQQLDLRNETIRLDEEISFHRERLADAGVEVDSLAVEMEEARTQLASSQQALKQKQDEYAEAENSVNEARMLIASLSSQQGNLQARLAERRMQAERHEQSIQKAYKDVEEANHSLQQSEVRLADAAKHFQQTETARQATEELLTAHRQKISDGEIARRKTIENQVSLRAEFARLTAQSDVLDQADQAFTGYSNGTRILLQAALETRLRGVRGAFSSLLDVPAEYEIAIAAALGNYTDAVVLDGEASAEEALQTLSEGIARAALLPLDTLYPSLDSLNQVPPEAVSASEVVQCAPEIRPAVDVLLGNTWIVADRRVARDLLRRLRANQQAVPGVIVITKQGGEVFHAKGPIVAGQETQGGVLARPRQRREIKEKIGAVEAQLMKVGDMLRQVDGALSQLRKEEDRMKVELGSALEAEKSARSTLSLEELDIEKIRRQHQFLLDLQTRLEGELDTAAGETRRIMEELSDFESQIEQARNDFRERNGFLSALSLEEAQSQLSHWKTQAAVIERASSDAKNRHLERETALDRTLKIRTAAQARLVEVQVALEDIDLEKTRLRVAEGTVNGEITEIQAILEPAEVELETAEAQQQQAQTIEAKARQATSQAEYQHAQARINLARRQETMDGLRQRIEDDFGLVALEYADEVSGPTPLPLDGMVEQLPKLVDLPHDLDENIKRQRALLRRMGPINPEAQKEHAEVQERFEFLTVQVADLQDAEAGIKEVIAELDLLMEREFRKTFDAVAHEFREIFSRLFGGGTARLVLTDPQDLTMTGIDIEARLPGRREQGLSLLSGGERSLTASALVFSLLKVSPTPFCVFDEVDAMLDEANVSRFRELLEELAQTTQFVIITHNRNTVQVADVIYGVTMGRDSASQVVSLKMDEVSRIVE